MISDDILEIRFVETSILLKLLSKRIKSENNSTEGCIVPKKLEPNNYIVCLVDKTTQDIISFIWFGIYTNSLSENFNSDSDSDFDFDYDLNISPHPIINRTYVHTNYSYTYKKYRNNGLNKKLRLWIETYCSMNKIDYIISLPLADSNSKYILKKLGYIKINNYYFKKILF